MPWAAELVCRMAPCNVRSRFSSSEMPLQSRPQVPVTSTMDLPRCGLKARNISAESNILISNTFNCMSQFLFALVLRHWGYESWRSLFPVEAVVFVADQYRDRATILAGVFECHRNPTGVVVSLENVVVDTNGV